MATKNIGKIGVRLSLGASGFAKVNVQRTVAATIREEAIGDAEADLVADLEREFQTIRELCELVLRIEQWKEDVQGERDQLAAQNVATRIVAEVDESELRVELAAEYRMGDLAPVVHPVTFPTAEALPSSEEVLGKLAEEWEIFQRVLSIHQVLGSDRETFRLPQPFLKSRTAGERPVETDELVARPATPTEAREHTERYLQLFHFPFSVEEAGKSYSFVPRVELAGGGHSIRLVMTVLIPSKPGAATLALTRSKEVALPVSEIYVQEGELNRKTKEGILELVKGLARTLGKEQGLTSEIDVSRPQ